MLQDNAIVETGFSLSNAVPAPPEPAERRREERHLTILRVGTLIVGDRRELCLVRNVSSAGLMAHVYSPLEPEERVAVELKSGQQIDGRVIWVREANAGIAFDTPVDVAGLLANPPVLDNGWRPRLPRVEVDRPATLRAGARSWRVRTRDISQGGIKISLDQPFEADEEVVLTLDGMRPLPGTVRWHDDGNCGIRFNALIPFDELIAWLKRAA